MAINRTAGTLVLNLDIEAELREYLDSYAASRKETRRKIVERALRREFTEPPPVDAPKPLPPISKLPPAPGRRKRK